MLTECREPKRFSSYSKRNVIVNIMKLLSTQNEIGKDAVATS